MGSASRRFVFGMALLAVVGCGKPSDKWMKNLPETVEARGVVLLDGKPAEGVAIVLAPAEAGGHSAMGLSGSGGAFILKAFPSKDGAVPGTYKVGLTRSEQAASKAKQIDWGEDAAHAAASPATSTVQNTLPAQYAEAAKSGLTLTIPPEGASDLKIEIKSAP